MDEAKMIKDACDIIDAMLQILKRKGKFNTAEYELAEQCKKNLKVAGTGAMKTIPAPMCDTLKASLIANKVPFASFDTAGGMTFIVDGKDETLQAFNEILENTCKSSTQGYKNLTFDELAQSAYDAGHGNVLVMSFGDYEVADGDGTFNGAKAMRDVAAQKMYQCGVVSANRKNPETGEYELMPHPSSVYNAKGTDLAYAELMISSEIAKDTDAFKEKANFDNALEVRLRQAEYDGKALDAVCESYKMDGVSTILCNKKTPGELPYIEIKYGKEKGSINFYTEDGVEQIEIPPYATDAEIKASISKNTEKIENMTMVHAEDFEAFKNGQKVSCYPGEDRPEIPKEGKNGKKTRAKQISKEVEAVLKDINKQATMETRKALGDVNPLDKKGAYEAYAYKKNAIKGILADKNNPKTQYLTKILGDSYVNSLVDSLDGRLDGQINGRDNLELKSKFHVDYNWNKLNKKYINNIRSQVEKGKVAEDRSPEMDR